MRETTFVAQKRISILRHAKAEPGDGMDDHARRLSPRGVADAARLGEFLKSKHLSPDYVLCSTAVRTRETLGQLTLQVPTTLSQRLYLANPGEIFTLLQEADESVQHLLVIGHNPGLHSLVALLADRYQRAADEELLTLKFPTSAYVSMAMPCTQWRALTPHTGFLDTLAIGSQL